MGSPHKYTTYGYGYGYWNEYGVTSRVDDVSQGTSYQVFPQENNGMPPYSYDEYVSIPWGSSEIPNGEDSELHTLLLFLEELYFESHDLFKKVFSQLEEKYLSKKLDKKDEHLRAKAFSKMLKKVPLRLHKKKLDELKVKTMKRSLSLHSPQTTPTSGKEESTLKLQRFKVKTLDSGGVQQDDKGTTRS